MDDSSRVPRSRVAKLAWLSALYLVQGLPFGFQANALGALLRSTGVSLTHIALTGVLALPWSLKALWAPLVDRHGSPRFGRRRAWIVPMQLALAGTALLASRAPIAPDPSGLLVAILAMNFFAATMDIAVDGLAIDLLDESELGLGNAAQVVGYKVGMLAGGGLLVWAATSLGWGIAACFVAMAALTLVVLAVTLALREPGDVAGAHTPMHTSLRAILGQLREAFARPEARWVVLLLATYKLGESLIDPVFQPVLVDQGFTAGQIGLVVGTWGMAASITGSLVGGLLASRGSIERAFVVIGGLRVVALAFQWSIAAFGSASAPWPLAWIALATCAEHLVSGALTTVMFAFMMRHVDRRVGATHYTVLATLEVLGKAPLSLASGGLADTFGASVTFAVAVVLALAWWAGFVSLRGRLRRA